MSSNIKKVKETVPVPSELRSDSNSVLLGRITKRHLKGKKDDPLLGSVMVWESKGIEYIVPVDDFRDMKFKKPRVYADQKKNLYLLTDFALRGLGVSESMRRDGIQASFTLAEYLQARGHTDEEIQKGGSTYDTARELIESGATTSYRKLFISKNRKKKDKQFIGTFYNLIKIGKADNNNEIKGKGTRFNVMFNAPYAQQIERMREEGLHHYSIPLKLIKDREVDKKPILFNFIDYLIYTNGGVETPTNIERLLREIGVREKYLKQRPNESFKILRDCISYAANKYSELLSVAFLYNDDRSKYVEIGIDSLKSLDKWELDDFRDAYLSSLEVEDFRECSLSFREKIQKIEPSSNSLELRSPLISEIMAWIDTGIQWKEMKRLTRKGTIKYLSDVLNREGEELLASAFELAQRNEKITPVFFLSMYLTSLIEKRGRSGKVKAIEEFLD